MLWFCTFWWQLLDSKMRSPRSASSIGSPMEEVAWYHTGLADPNSSVPLRMLSTSTDLYFETKEASESGPNYFNSFSGSSYKSFGGSWCWSHLIHQQQKNQQRGLVQNMTWFRGRGNRITSCYRIIFRCSIGSLALSRSCLWNLLPISNQWRMTILMIRHFNDHLLKREWDQQL